VAVAAGDAGEEPRVATLDALLDALGVAAEPSAAGASGGPDPAGVAAATPEAPPPAGVEALEEALARLCTPLEPGERTRAAEEAARWTPRDYARAAKETFHLLAPLYRLR